MSTSREDFHQSNGHGDAAKVSSSKAIEEQISKRFQIRAIELAKQGVFGSLKTRISSLQNAYALMISLLDQSEIPFLIYGEPGSGKRRHVDEYLVIQNFFYKLRGESSGTLKVYRADFLKPGFTAQWQSPHCSSQDLIYLENVERLDRNCQKELWQYLSQRKLLAKDKHRGPRIIVGTERALSIAVLKQDFDRALFQALTTFALFLPSLNERSEDLPYLIQALAQEFSGRVHTPPVWFVDHCSHLLWPDNVAELKRLLKAVFSRNPQMEQWKEKDLPEAWQLKAKAGRAKFSKAQIPDFTELVEEKKRLKQALIKNGGNRQLAAQNLGMGIGDFLSRLVATGLR